MLTLSEYWHTHHINFAGKQGVLYQHGEGEGVLDGMAIDDAGMLWVACFLGSKVIRIDPKSGNDLNDEDMQRYVTLGMCM